MKFTLPPGEWHNPVVTIPAEGALGILRVYLPAQKQPVDLDWVELRPNLGKARRWDF